MNTDVILLIGKVLPKGVDQHACTHHELIRADQRETAIGAHWRNLLSPANLIHNLPSEDESL